MSFLLRRNPQCRRITTHTQSSSRFSSFSSLSLSVNSTRRRYSMASSPPPWLSLFLDDKSPAPRIYSWTPAPQPPSPPLPDPRRIFILGVGNIGRLYAAHLARHHPNPPPITLILHRRDLLSHWAANPGIEITRGGVVETTREGLDVEYWTEEPPRDQGSAREIDHIDNLIITTKSEAALPEADRLRRYLDGNSTVAFAQNGMSKLWPPHGPTYVACRYPNGDAPNFAACITTHGVTSLGPFKSNHASPADAKVGLVLPNPSSAPKAEYLMQAVASAPQLHSQHVPRADLWVLQLEKLLVNSVINPMTAVLRCKNGALFADKTGLLVDVMDRLLEETSNIYQALVNHPSTVDILASSTHSELSASSDSLDATRRKLMDRFAVESLRDLLWSVGYKVTENTSSMLQDVKAGKRTEIRDFNGWIVDMGRFLDKDLDVSSHQKLIALVESGRVLDQKELGKAIFG